MNEKDFVTLEVAKLLKEKNFNKDYNVYYDKDELFIFPYRYMKIEYLEDGTFPTYTLYEVQKWLRENHNIHITIGNSASGYWWELSKADNGTTICDYNYSGPNDGGKWDTYEDALNFGILKALKRI